MTQSDRSTWMSPRPQSNYQKGNYWLITSPPGQPLHECPTKQREIVERYKRAALNWVDGLEKTPLTNRYHTHILLVFPEAIYLDINELETWHYDIVDPTRLDVVSNYVKKSGNYTCLEEQIPSQYLDPLPRWRPWQRMVLEEANDGRKVILVYDSIGNTGKSYLSHWFAVRHRAALIPIMRGYQDFMRMLYSVESPLYFVDVPRGLAGTSYRALFSAIETAKNGFSYDDRYEYKYTFRDPPKIVVFSNTVPDLDLLSPDRWVFVIPEPTERLSYVEMKLRIEQEHENEKRKKRNARRQAAYRARKKNSETTEVE